MKATELRIGNFVMVNNELMPEIKKDVFSITGINLRSEKDFPLSDSVISLSRHNSWMTYNQFNEYIEPLPLTEEWLLRFGFKYQDRDVSHGNGKIERFFIKGWHTDGDEYWIEINLHPIKQGRHGFYWLNWNIGGGNDFVHLPHSCNLAYVHQLQNLYHALTGEELKIQ